jgi:hypothetical protein
MNTFSEIKVAGENGPDESAGGWVLGRNLICPSFQLLTKTQGLDFSFFNFPSAMINYPGTVSGLRAVINLTVPDKSIIAGTVSMFSKRPQPNQIPLRPKKIFVKLIISSRRSTIFFFVNIDRPEYSNQTAD